MAIKKGSRTILRTPLIDLGVIRPTVLKHLHHKYNKTFMIEEEIRKLESQLTGDMFQDMDIKDRIHNLQMQLDGVKPEDTHIDCIGCGS